MSHIDERLLERVAYGFKGGPTFYTEEERQKNGVRVATAVRARPLYRFSCPYQNLEPEDHATIIETFNACQGKAHSFLFRDLADFNAVNQFVAVATGSPQTVKLYKYYQKSTLTTARRIAKPDIATCSLSAATAPTGVTFDLDDGTVTFTGTAGQTVTWSGEFDVPVHFANDDMIFDYNNFEALTTDVDLEEELMP